MILQISMKNRKIVFLTFILIVLYLLGMFIFGYINDTVHKQRLLSEARLINEYLSPHIDIQNPMDNSVLEKAFVDLKKKGAEIDYDGWQAVNNPNPVYPCASIDPEDYSILIFNKNKTRWGFVVLRSDGWRGLSAEIPTGE